MSETLRVLQVEDSESDAALIVRHLQKAGYTIHATRVDKAEAMKKALAASEWDVIIADYQIPQFGAGEALKIRNRHARDVPFIIVSGTIGEDTAVEMMRAGAQDYILKHRMVRLAAAVQRETQAARSRAELHREYKSLANQLRIKEQHAEARRLKGEQSARENTILLQEVHHRVRNNLQLISSLLAMQIDCLGEDDRFTAPLHRAHHRVLAMALIHEQLFESTAVESDLDFAQYVQALSAKLYQAYSVDPARVRFETEIARFPLTVDDAMSCGLILNELLANSLKHAFPKKRPGLIQFHLKQVTPTTAQFSFTDNGVGLPSNFDHDDIATLGLTLVQALVTQMDAELTISTAPGATYTFEWDVG
jgi:two-component sensor histidine kinase